MHESCHPNRGVVQQSINTHTHTHTHPLTHYPWNCPFLRLFGHTHTTDTDTDVDTDTHMKETHPSCDCVISSSNESRYILSVLLGSPAIDSSRLCVAICFSVFQCISVCCSVLHLCRVLYTWISKFRLNPVVFCRMVQRVALTSPTVDSISPEVFPPHPQKHLPAYSLGDVKKCEDLSESARTRGPSKWPTLRLQIPEITRITWGTWASQARPTALANRRLATSSHQNDSNYLRDVIFDSKLSILLGKCEWVKQGQLP